MSKIAMTVLVVLAAGFAVAGTVVDQGNGGPQPWTVKCTNCPGGGGVGSDAGFLFLGQYYADDGGTPQHFVRVDSTGAVVIGNNCFNPTNSVVNIGVDAGPAPVTALSGRRFAQVCNDPRNTSSSFLVCSETAVPTAATGSAGDTLFPGDCATYSVPSTTAITCIANAANTYTQIKQCF